MSGRRSRGVLVVLLSVGTAVWLTAQVTATVKRSTDLWPASGVALLSKRQVAGFRSRIMIGTSSGRVRQVRPADVGAPSLDSYRARLIFRPPHGVPRAAAGAAHRFGRLVAAWNRIHPGERAVSATLSVEVLSLPSGRRSRVYRVLRWP